MLKAKCNNTAWEYDRKRIPEVHFKYITQQPVFSLLSSFAA
jgi:hypothetical protein